MNSWEQLGRLSIAWMTRPIRRRQIRSDWERRQAISLEPRRMAGWIMPAPRVPFE